MSMPSIMILPPLDLIIRKMLRTREVLPLPVRPQIPIFWPGSMESETLLSTGSDVLLRVSAEFIRDLVIGTYLYSAQTALNSIAPCAGQDGGGVTVSVSRSSGTEVVVKLLIL